VVGPADPDSRITRVRIWIRLIFANVSRSSMGRVLRHLDAFQIRSTTVSVVTFSASAS